MLDLVSTMSNFPLNPTWILVELELVGECQVVRLKDGLTF